MEVVISDERLSSMLNNYKDSYLSIVNVVLSVLNEQTSSLGLPVGDKAKFILRGIELCNDTAMKIAVTVEANRDNLLVKALDSNSQMIGMMAQGGLKIEETQFKIYYEALKEVLAKGGVTIQEAYDALMRGEN